jgi:hypothetical protein
MASNFTNLTTQPDFLRGLVFGFDVGTGSLGWAVRRGAQFSDPSARAELGNRLMPLNRFSATSNPAK